MKLEHVMNVIFIRYAAFRGERVCGIPNLLLGVGGCEDRKELEGHLRMVFAFGEGDKV